MDDAKLNRMLVRAYFRDFVRRDEWNLSQIWRDISGDPDASPQHYLWASVDGLDFVKHIEETVGRAIISTEPDVIVHWQVGMAYAAWLHPAIQIHLNELAIGRGSPEGGGVS